MNEYDTFSNLIPKCIQELVLQSKHPSARLDDYEVEFLGKNLFDYDDMFWFAHDFYYRLIDLSKLIFGVEPEPEIEYSGSSGFSNLVPMVLAEVN